MATFQVGATIITFRLLIDGAEFDQPPVLLARHIPGGNVTYLTFAGLEAATIKGRVQLDTFADLRALQALGGQEGTLDYTEVPAALATLRTCVRTKVTGRLSTIQFASVEFEYST